MVEASNWDGVRITDHPDGPWFQTDEKLADRQSDRFRRRHTCIWVDVENDTEGWQSPASITASVAEASTTPVR